MTKKGRKRHDTGRAIGILIFIACLVAAGTLVYYVLRVDAVEVEGNSTVGSDKILNAAKIEVGSHMLLLDAEEIESAIEEDPYIADAELKRIFPSTVRLVITEREPRAVVVGIGANALIDAEGFVMEIMNTLPEGRLVVYGMGSAGYQLNGRIGETDDFHTRTLTAMLAAVDKAGLHKEISSIDLTNSLAVTMFTNSGFTVLIGQPENLEDKMYKLSGVLPKMRQMGLEGGTVNVALRDDAVYSPKTEPLLATDTDTEPTDDTDTGVG